MCIRDRSGTAFGLSSALLMSLLLSVDGKSSLTDYGAIGLAAIAVWSIVKVLMLQEKARVGISERVRRDEITRCKRNTSSTGQDLNNEGVGEEPVAIGAVERIEADEWGKVAKDIRKSFRLNVLLFFGAIVAALIVRLVRDS